MLKILKSHKVILREKRSEDAANDYAWRCDEELAQLDATPVLRIPSTIFQPIMPMNCAIPAGDGADLP